MSEHNWQETATADGRPTVILGRERVTLDRLLDGEQVALAERSISFRCTSGGLIRATWRGVPLVEVLSAGDPPAETTHVLLESGDGHTACVTVAEATEGLLAVEQDGERLPSPRFVVPDVPGPRTVQGIRRIEAVELGPTEDRSDYESFRVDPYDPD